LFFNVRLSSDNLKSVSTDANDKFFLR